MVNVRSADAKHVLRTLDVGKVEGVEEARGNGADVGHKEAAIHASRRLADIDSARVEIELAWAAHVDEFSCTFRAKGKHMGQYKRSRAVLRLDSTSLAEELAEENRPAPRTFSTFPKTDSSTAQELSLRVVSV